MKHTYYIKSIDINVIITTILNIFVTETFASPNEMYPTKEQACYLKYPCAYCLELSYLVEPDTHRAGGGIMHEKIRNIEDNTVIETGRSHFMCLPCIQYDKFRQRNRDFLVS